MFRQESDEKSRVARVLRLAVASNRLDRAGLEGRLATCFFFRGSRLLIDEGVSVFVVSGEIIGSLGSTGIAVDALIIHIELPGFIVRPLLGEICHSEKFYGQGTPRSQGVGATLSK